MTDALFDEIRQRWADAAAVPVSAFATGLQVTAAQSGQTAPPGWCGAIAIGDRLLVTAPNEASARALAAALLQSLAGRPDGAAGDQLLAAVTARALEGVTQVLGPAWLSYAAPSVRDAPAAPAAPLMPVAPVAPLAPLAPSGAARYSRALPTSDAGDLHALLRACTPEEVGESGVKDMTGLQVVRDGNGVVVAVAGWQHWPGGIAHIGVLAAPWARGGGAASTVAAAAVSAALQQGLLVQWRARPAASRRLAQRLGLVQVGWQVSWRWERPGEGSSNRGSDSSSGRLGSSVRSRGDGSAGTPQRSAPTVT